MTDAAPLTMTTEQEQEFRALQDGQHYAGVSRDGCPYCALRHVLTELDATRQCLAAANAALDEARFPAPGRFGIKLLFDIAAHQQEEP